MPGFLNSWAAKAGLIVLAVTLARIGALALTQADIFVDEAQYWLWGQNLDFGYYSKPPLIAWVIRAMTDIAGSDSAFWIRFPAPVFHAATSMILGIWAARVFDDRTGFWTAIGYVTLPIVSVGSIMISTDTIMAPFFAAGLFFYWRMLDTGKLWQAIAAGAMIGLAFMAKYAGIYFFLGASLSAIFIPGFRPSLRNAMALLLAFAAVISPNIAWNLSHDLTTAQHTMDNVSWVRREGEGSFLHPAALLEFVATQFAVAGPVFFAAFLLSVRAVDPRIRSLLWFSLPILALVCLQALLSRAYGNWAFAAYLAGTLAATAWLLARSGRWLWLSFGINGGIALALPLITILGTGLTIGGHQLLGRYTGRDEISRHIIGLADEIRPSAIVTSDRDLLADLFLTGRRNPIPVRAVPPEGRAMNYYEQTFPLDPATKGTILFITSQKQVRCNGQILSALAPIDTTGTAYEGRDLRAYMLKPDCFAAMR